MVHHVLHSYGYRILAVVRDRKLSGITFIDIVREKTFADNHFFIYPITGYIRFATSFLQIPS